MNDLPLLLLLILALAVLLRLDFAFYIVYVLAGVFLLAQTWTGRILPRLRVDRRFTDRVFQGEVVPVELHIANGSRWPATWLRCEESPPTALDAGSRLRHVIALRGRQRVVLRYELVGQRRGCYEIGPTIFRAGDLFGFVESQGRLEPGSRLTVYPRVIPLGRPLLTSSAPHGTIGSRQPIFADPARVIGLRDYAPGDPPHSIAWKSSARAAALQVKKYEPAVSLTSVIFLDLHPAAYGRQTCISASEWGIVVAASVANWLIEQRQAVGLTSNGQDALSPDSALSLPPRNGRNHLMKLLETLARVQLAERAMLPQWLSAAASDLAWGATAIVITPTGDATTCAALHRLRRRGLNPVLLVIEPHGQFGLVAERARRLGIAAFQIADEQDLNRWGADVRRGRVDG